MYKVESGIDIPQDKRGYRSRKYPFYELGVGDSFFVEGVKNAVSVSTVYANRLLRPKHFITRSVEGGIRVWRDK